MIMYREVPRTPVRCKDECHAIHIFDAVRYFLLIRWRCWSRNFNTKKQSSRFDAFGPVKCLRRTEEQAWSTMKLVSYTSAIESPKPSLGPRSKRSFWEVLLSQQTDYNCTVRYWNTFEVIRFSLDGFHKRSWDPSNLRDRISWGFNAEVVGLGLVEATMVRNSEVFKGCSWLYLLHAWLLHMDKQSWKIYGGWGLECYGHHGRLSKF